MPSRRRRRQVAPGSVHFGLWRLDDGTRFWALSAPYDPKLISAIKRLPAGTKTWIRDVKVWLFEREYEPSVRGVCEALYLSEALCATCWSGASCPDQAELAGAMGAMHLTSRMPTPVPPKPAAPPPVADPVAAAAARLGLTEYTDADAVKRRARKLAAMVHPDREGGSEEATKAILAARDVVLAAIVKPR